MSRLQEHQKKRLMQTTIFFACLLTVIFIFIFTIGFKLLLASSAFIAQLTSKKNAQNTPNKDSDFIGTIDIDNIAVATNSSQIVVSGSVLNFDDLDFYINGEKVKNTNVSTKDSFTEQIGELKKGDNEIYINAIAKETKKEKQSKKYSVVYKSEKPKLEIKSPVDNFKTSKSELKIGGSTDKETYIRVNDGPVVVDVLGNFQTSLKLAQGENKIKVSAADIAGNIEEKTITVTYQKED